MNTFADIQDQQYLFVSKIVHDNLTYNIWILHSFKVGDQAYEKHTNRYNHVNQVPCTTDSKTHFFSNFRRSATGVLS